LASSSGSHVLTSKKLYFGKDILPDNIMYPVLMAVDRVELETAPNSEQIYIQIEYANRRLNYAQQLIDQQKEVLAVSTLTKAENYLADAAAKVALNEDTTQTVKDDLSRAIRFHIDELQKINPKLTDADRALIDKLIEQNDFTLKTLQSP
jgi:flagellin-specific chaperone FliS